MARILRGDIRWADLNPTRGHEQAGLRPVVILSHDIFNERSGTVIAMAITSQSQRAGFPLTLGLYIQKACLSVRGLKSVRFALCLLSGLARSSGEHRPKS